MKSSILNKRKRLAKTRVKYLRANPTYYETLVRFLLDEIKEEYIFQYALFDEWYFLIADFFIPKYKVLLEVDGGYHKEKKKQEQEKKRELWLNDLGYKVVRIDNKDVYTLTKRKLKSLLKKQSYG